MRSRCPIEWTEAQQDELVDLLAKCVSRAYREMGYGQIKWPDGSIGVIDAPRTLMETVLRVQQHFYVAIGAADYADGGDDAVRSDRDEPIVENPPKPKSKKRRA